MPFDGSGNFNRTFPPGGWKGDASSNIKILADRHDTHDKDLADGLSNCITKDGQTTVTANIPMSGKRITGLGDPVNDDDAATLKSVKGVTGWTTSLNLSGADLNGRINFNSLTGVNGISWASIDASWVAKKGEADKTPDRLVFNDTFAATAGNDVFNIDKGGRVTSVGQFMNNLFWDGDEWRSPTTAIPTLLSITAGALKMWASDAVTAGANLVPAIREYFRVTNTNGTTQLDLVKSASGKNTQIRTYMGTNLRWTLDLGNTVAEDSASAGSNFYLQSYNNAGTAIPVMHAYRVSGDVIFYQDVTIQKTLSVTGNLTLTGSLNASAETATFSICAAQYFDANSGVLGGNNSLYLRPVDYSNSTGQATLNNAGDLTLSRYIYAEGYQERSGTTGSYGGEFYNWYWNGFLYAYINTTSVGYVTVSCDYRIKKDVKPLASTWDKVKALHPISYTIKDYFAEDGTHLFKESDDVQWGFLAHELQGTLLKTAASGVKDAPNEIQGPNLLAVVAGLTAALQEAMARIEALEARP